jgi:hypothetical protein
LPHTLKYRVLSEPLAVCRLACDAPVPAGLLDRSFFCATRTAEELSLVCPEDCAPDAAVIERGWIALQLQGPFPFSLTGVLSSFLQPLALAQIPIFAISTFDTDHVLIKQANLDQAVAVLNAAGHERIRD